MDMTTVIDQMLVLVALMVIGYALGKLKIIDLQGNKLISQIVLKIATPANIISAMLGGELGITGSGALLFAGATAACFIIYYLVSLVVPRLIAAPEEDRSIYQYMLIFSNCGYMGYPVAHAIFGDTGTIYVTFFVTAFNILVFSLGISLMQKGHGQFKIKSVINPAIIATAFSLILLVTGVKLPVFVLGTAESLSKVMTPLAMLSIGVTLSAVPLKQVFSDWRIIPMTVVRIILLPLIVWLILRNFVTDPTMLGVATILSGMPVASVATMMCLQYNRNDKLTSTTTFLTTVLTAVTVPLVVYFLL